ncbi:MAG: hypothetical protein JHC95_13820 [Solirubrobacteraceae bacterium]|nr:hypothetical protein [Solirubrobacteraceae bacterium]
MAATDTITAPLHPSSPEFASLLERIAAGTEEREREKRGPYEVIGWLKEAGFGRLRIPVEEGGLGLSVREFFAALIALAEADSNAAHILRVHFSFVEQQLNNPDLENRARWIALLNSGAIVGNAQSEQNGGAVGGDGLETTITPDPSGTGYRLSGVKYYSTGSLYSDWIQAIARTPDNKIAAALVGVDREGVELVDDWDGFGQTLTGTGTTRFSDVYVAEEEYTEWGTIGDPLPATYNGAFLQLYLQGVTAGVLRAVRRDAASLVNRRRRSFGHALTESPIEDPQVLQVVGEIAADAFAAEAIVLSAADAIDRASATVVDGFPDPAAAHAAQIASASAKVAIDRFSYAVAARLFDAGGASATQSRYALDRHWRNVRTISTHNPTHLKATALGRWFVSGEAPPQNGFF